MASASAIPPLVTDAAAQSRSLRRYNSGGFDNLLDIINLFCVLIMSISSCWWYCSGGLARHRRKKMEMARKKIIEYKLKRRQALDDENGSTSDSEGRAKSKYQVFDIAYNGCTRGKGLEYGHGELHLAISSLSPSPPPSDALATSAGFELENKDKAHNSNLRTLYGCGIREFEYTEIAEGYIDLTTGHAEWIERATREISYHPPGGYHHRADYYYDNIFHLRSHVGPCSIKSRGRFVLGNNDTGNECTDINSFEGEYYGKDECPCNECKVYWLNKSRRGMDGQWGFLQDDMGAAATYISNCGDDNASDAHLPLALYGERVRWCPGSERRKIGEYILFRLKEDESTVESVGGPSADNSENIEEERDYHNMMV